jgi:hypothetical protein
MVHAGATADAVENSGDRAGTSGDRVVIVVKSETKFTAILSIHTCATADAVENCGDRAGTSGDRVVIVVKSGTKFTAIFSIHTCATADAVENCGDRAGTSGDRVLIVVKSGTTVSLPQYFRYTHVQQLTLWKIVATELEPLATEL